MQYDKLIRDNIPAIIEAAGKRAEITTLDEAEYKRALLQKLVEEAREVQESTPEEMPTELADVLEVLDALCETLGLPLDEIRRIQTQRREERGGFSRKLFLHSVNAAAD